MFATTLALFLGLWPHAYLLQVGDSRCYIHKDGSLTQISMRWPGLCHGVRNEIFS